MTQATEATLDAWRERGHERLDPVRFRFIEALARRAAGHHGEARRVLDERLATLLAGYAEKIAQASSFEAVKAAALENPPSASALAALIGLAPPRAAYPELDALDYFRDVWAKVRTEKQLRQSLEQVPGNAGPLNSSSLVHRSLSLMRELSPGYLKQFLAYADALSWMEQMGGGPAPGKDAPRATTGGKSARKAR